MSEIKYSEKEKAILNGMINLIKSGANPYLVKVSDIAKSAGVGKGTIYDYFQTKEEVILKAMLLNISNEIDLLAKRIDAKSRFKEKYYEVLSSIVENLQNKFSTFNILISSGKLPEFKDNHMQGNHHCSSHRNRIEAIIDQLLSAGYKEGAIKDIESKAYQRMVMNGSLFAFGNYLTMQKHYPGISLQEAMDYSYKIIMKSLN
ncbi:TetR/AcrR family transcriptional regulator [Irregularibacter muris]|uniref:TetR/AcrR family transcriptional regulator n=1 Tax=Irregularibacter muris TaxID=1796619 RepID=A0AAE3HDH5_9FIRM|nr:TetR/AcrR family transcriptional regulator [Irregularibacter muris]MCR1898555.1 TetR/AcrR family transcriptional regulator [Irregularibacter muris]